MYLQGQLNRSKRKNILLLPGKMGAAETGGLMYLRGERVEGGVGMKLSRFSSLRLWP